MKAILSSNIKWVFLIVLGILFVIWYRIGIVQPVIPNLGNKLSNQKRLPVEVVPMKDGETTRMVSIGLPNRKFNKLCFVNSDDPKLGGKIYINENWRSINEKPLAWDEAKIALDQVEALLYSFYGSEKMYRLIKNRKAIKTMSQETLTKYMADPELNDELDASFALDLIYEFRGYFDLKIKP